MSTQPMTRVLGSPVLAPGTRRLGGAGEGVFAPPSDAMLDHTLGFDQGYADGMRQAAADCEARLLEVQARWQEEADARLRHATAELAEHQAALDASVQALNAALDGDRVWAEGLAAELAMQALTSFLLTVPTPDVIAQIIRRATVAQATPPHHVRVSAMDATNVSALETELRIVTDSSLKPGECVLDFATGEIDAGLPGRLHAITDAFLLALGETSHGEPR